jgi:squalene-hopene/tetraprenyl-beta-curcumene cyclase
LTAGSDPIDTSISRGIEFLMGRLKEDGTWDEKEFTGTGFPNHFYIRYHGYRHFFPLLALGRYINTPLSP